MGYPVSLKKTLARIKHYLDPHNILRANHNIDPQEHSWLDGARRRRSSKEEL